MISAIKNYFKRKWENFKKNVAPPPKREIHSAYQVLQLANKRKVTYSQILYQLAKRPSSLRIQKEAEGLSLDELKNKTTTIPCVINNKVKTREVSLYDQLYWSDGTKKTAFELAIVDLDASNDIELKQFNKYVITEAQWQNDNGRLPQTIFKARLQSNWLAGLADQNANSWFNRFKNWFRRAPEKINIECIGDAQSSTLEVNNQKPKTSEKFLHATAQILGWLLALSTAGGAIATIGAKMLPIIIASASIPLLGCSMVGMLVLMYCINKIYETSHILSFLHLAETLWNELPWSASGKFLRSEGKFSFLKTLKTLSFIGVIGLLAGMGASTVFFAATSTLMGVILAPTAFISIAVGAFVPISYLVGLGFLNNNVVHEDLKRAEIRLVSEFTSEITSDNDKDKDNNEDNTKENITIKEKITEKITENKADQEFYPINKSITSQLDHGDLSQSDSEKEPINNIEYGGYFI